MASLEKQSAGFEGGRPAGAEAVNEGAVAAGNPPVHEEAARRGFRSRLRVLSNGKTVGGSGFSRGHIHQMLSNPIHAGRIRHRTLVHDGLHPAIAAARTTLVPPIRTQRAEEGAAAALQRRSPRQDAGPRISDMRALVVRQVRVPDRRVQSAVHAISRSARRDRNEAALVRP